MQYVLGIDVGIASVGWAVYNLDRQRIEDLGVRAFNAAEEPKTKAPLAESRRLARGARRRLRRRAGRLKRAKELFVQTGLIKASGIETAFTAADGRPDPWQLRADGLDRLLSGEEFARALFHIIKRRGFKSNRKKDRSAEDAESKKVLGCIEENRKRLTTGGYRTAGEMYFRDAEFQGRKRNSTGFYGFSVDRALLEDEIRKLFAAQRNLGSAFATSQLEQDLLHVFTWQMPFAKGDQILKLVGQCTFEPAEMRAPKAAYTAERCTLLQHINRLIITDGGTERRLSPEERATAEQMAYTQADVKYAQLRKKLGLKDSERFKGLTYSRRVKDETVEEMSCEKAVFSKLTGYHAIRKAMGDNGLWEQVKNSPGTMDTLAFALTFYKTDEDIRQCLQDAGLPPEIMQAAENIPQFSKVGNMSVLAMRKIMPFLEQGMIYSEACEAAGYNHSDFSARVQKGSKLPVIAPSDVRNPVVLRALSQARKVINAIVRKHGLPCRVHIELAREIGKSAQERKEIDKRIEENRAEKQREREYLREEFHQEPSEDARIRFRLYREQNGRCAYCQTELDTQRAVLESGYVEVDHILPYSRSFDDSLNNRALVCSRCNQQKRNRTPHEWFGQDAARWELYEAWVRASIRHPRKRANLLAKDYEKRQSDWMQRNLNDTQWIARFLAGYIRQHLQTADPSDKAPIMCLSGRVTAIARGLWGIAKVREENDLHHAADAAVIAAMTPAMTKRITEYHKALENGWLHTETDTETGEITEFLRGHKFIFPEPWQGFRREVLARLSDDPAQAIAQLSPVSYAEDAPEIRPVIVSRMPVHKAGGALHAETIRAVRVEEDKRVSVVRKPLTSITAADIANLCDESGLLAKALREQLDQYGGDAKKAFAEPFYAPRPKGENRLVKAVRVKQTQPSGIQVRHGVADNASMVRVDVFRKDGKYYLVPVYTSDVAAGVLPNRAIVAHKPEDKWLEMDRTYEFLFSLRPYDLVRIVNCKTEFLGYYRGTDRDTSKITVSSPNKNDEAVRFGPRLALSIEKLGVTVLGDTYPIPKEKRHGVADSSDNQPREAPG